jgi:hypothetical protein
MASMNTRGNESQSFKQIEGGTWSSIYLPAICACVLMSIVLFLAVSCSKKTDSEAKIKAPSAPAVSDPTPSMTAAAAVPEKPKKAVKKHRPANATYVNGTYGVSFSYPRKYSLQAGSKNSPAPVQAGFLKPGAVQVAAVDMPDDSYPETDFSSALFTVSVNKSMTEQECSQFVAGEKGAQQEKPAAVKLGSNEFTELEQMSGEPAHQSDLKYFHLFKNGACYEFSADVETSRKADQELAQVERGKVFQQLEKIVASARIKEVEIPGVVNAQKPAEATVGDSSMIEKAQVAAPTEQN